MLLGYWELSIRWRWTTVVSYCVYKIANRWCITRTERFLIWEHWSSGYGRKLTFQRLWVWIPAPDTGWTWHFFTLICYKDCIVCLKKTENKRKRGQGWPIFLKKISNLGRSSCSPPHTTTSNKELHEFFRFVLNLFCTFFSTIQIANLTSFTWSKEKKKNTVEMIASITTTTNNNNDYINTISLSRIAKLWTQRPRKRSNVTPPRQQKQNFEVSSSRPYRRTCPCQCLCPALTAFPTLPVKLWRPTKF